MDYHIKKNQIHRNKTTKGCPGSLDGKESACSGGDLGSVPGSGRSPEKGWLPTPVVLPEEFHGRSRSNRVRIEHGTTD